MKQVKGKKDGSDGSEQKSDKKRELEARRLKVAELMLRGLFYFKIAEELGVSLPTIERDVREIKKARIEKIARFVNFFDLNEFWQKKLERIELMRQKAWDLLNDADERGKGAIIREIRNLDLEEEQALNKLGIETSRVSPEKVAGNRIVFYEDLGDDPAEKK